MSKRASVLPLLVMLVLSQSARAWAQPQAPPPNDDKKSQQIPQAEVETALTEKTNAPQRSQTIIFNSINIDVVNS